MEQSLFRYSTSISRPQTDRFHIQRVHIGDAKVGAGLVWRPISRDVPAEFVEEVRQVINVQPGLPAAA